MAEHPISGLMSTAMESIKDMVDVNTIVGDSVETADGTVIIPISKVSFGFAAGGSEFGDGKKETKDELGSKNFGGGSGAGVSIHPVAFMVVGNGNIRLIPVDSNTPVERALDFVPDIIDKIYNALENRKNNKTATVKEEPVTPE